MGVSIVIKGADFSGFGLGNVDPLVNFFNNAGVTSPTIKSAYSDILVSGLKDNGLWDLIDVIYTFEGLTSQSQGLNLKNPVFTDQYFGNFLNDSSAGHTDKGFVSNESALRVMDTNFKVPTSGFTNGFSMGVYNSTSSSTGLLAMLTQSTPVNVGQIGLGRKEIGGGFTLGWYGYKTSDGSSLYVGGDYPSPNPNGVGFLQLLATKDTTNLYLVDGGVLKSTATREQEPNGLSRSILIGGNRLHTDGSINLATTSTFPFAYFAKSGLTVSQSETLNTIVFNFLTAVSRN